MITSLLLAAIAATQPAAGDSAQAMPGLDRELTPPVRIEAAGKPIDTVIGHAAPFVGDFDGDGVPDLLVGQFGGGELWVYHNDGTAKQPKLAEGQKFIAGAQTGVVPAG
jgi:hypothetical protein